MTDLVPYDGRSLVTWAQEADAAYALAERMVDTAFCPQQFRGKPVEAAAAVLAGAEVGLSPLAALRSFDIIQGVAAPRALTLRAIAQANGAQFQTTEESERKVVMRARRLGGEWETVTWTIERATKLGLHTKDNWKKQPQAMLVARATAELARRVAADAILGLGFAAEEVDVEESPNGKRTVARKPKIEPADPTSGWDEPKALAPGRDTVLRAVADVDLPPLPEEAVGQAPEPVQTSAPEPTITRPPGSITQPQMRMMMALLKQAGLSEREDRLDYCQTVIGRQVESSADLTKGEAQQILDCLVALTDAASDDPEPGFDDEPHPDQFVQLPYKDD